MTKGDKNLLIGWSTVVISFIGFVFLLMFKNNVMNTAAPITLVPFNIGWFVVKREMWRREY